MSRFTTLVALVVAFGLGFRAQTSTAAPPPADLVQVTVTGESGISFEAAQEDAFRKAVEQGAGTEVFADTRVADFALMHDTIVTRAAGYLAGYDVVDKVQVGRVYNVTLRATVAVGRIRDDWGTIQILLQRKGRPNLLLVVDERGDRGSNDAGRTAEFKLRDRLLQRGFDLVDDQALARVADRDTVRAIAAGDLRKAATVARQLHAGYVLTGELSVIPEAAESVFGVTLHAVAVTLNVKAVAADNAQLLASKSISRKASSETAATATRNALDQAVAECEQEAVRAILDAWSKELYSGGKTEVWGTRLPTDTVNALVDRLRGTEGVRTVSIVDHNAEESTLTVVSRFETKDLGNLITRVADGQVEVKSLSPGRIELVARTRLLPRFSSSANSAHPAAAGVPTEKSNWPIWLACALGLVAVGTGAFAMGRRSK